MIEWLEKNRKFSIFITILIALEIFIISSIPGGKTSAGINLSLIYHLVVFFLFGFFLLISIKGNKELNPKHLIITILISIVYSILDEIHQFFIPFRYPSIKDVLIDSTGIFLSILTYMYYKRKIT